MPQSNILLLTDVFPCKKYSGSILSEQLSQFLLDDNYSLYCVCIKNKVLKFDYVDDELTTKVTTLFLDKPYESKDNDKTFDKEIEIIIKKTIKFIDDNNIDIVWCPVQGETLLRVLSAVQKERSYLRVVPQVWDPIKWVFHDLSYTKEKTSELVKIFDNVLKKSDAILTASDAMSEAYEKKYKVKCRPAYLAFDIDEEYNIEKTSDFVILMAGQPYASLGIDALLDAMDSINWKYKNKKIIFRVFGNPMYCPFKDDPRVDFRGFVSQDILIEEQKKADLLYCSYFFDKHPVFKEVSQLSYPSKVTSYIPSGVPIIIHSFDDTSIYKHVEKYNAGYLLNSVDKKDIIKTIKEAIDNQGTVKEKKLVKNAYKLFKETFGIEKNKKDFFEVLDLPYKKTNKKRLLEINYIDLPGKRFNGYDIMEELNKKKDFLVNQLVTHKQSDNKNVIKLYNDREQQLEYALLEFEDKYLSVHNCLSNSSPHILSSETFKKSDIVHIHMIHNLKMSLISLIDICNRKPTVISIHDPWTFTGRCVHYGECDKYLSGCDKCRNLDTLFPLRKDNCSELWKIKKYVYKHLDVDYVVSSKYMYDLFNKSPLTKGNRVHLIPFGIDIDYFSSGITQEIARKRYNIPKDNIVIFHRAQKEFKGTNYLVEALKMLKTDKNITIITCSEKGLLFEIEYDYQVIELGNIDSEELRYAYNACDIFLMPSIGESFGLMAIEAMSCSKPIIVFNNTALPSVTFAPDCGIAVENKNSTKLMEAIKLLVEDDEERLRRGKLSRKVVKENYDVNIYNKKMEELYKEVLSRKHDYSKISVLNSKIENNNNVKYMKYMLNSLTKQLFDKESLEYNNLIYSKEEIKNPRWRKIEYSDISVQLLLNNYNNKIAEYGHDFAPKESNYSYLDKFKLYRMTKRFIYLILHDRHLLVLTIKRKFNTLTRIILRKNK